MLFTRSPGAKTLKTNIHSFTMLFTCSHVFPFQLSASNNQLVRMFQVAKLHHLKVRLSLLFPSFTIIITLIIPSSLPWPYHHLPHHDHHDCYHNHHLKLERSFFCSFKIVAFYCVSPPSADIFSFVSFCTSFVIPHVNFNLSEYNNPPISNWSFAQWLIMLNFSCKLPVTKMIQSCIILLLLQFYITTTTCCIWIILNCIFAL